MKLLVAAVTLAVVIVVVFVNIFILGSWHAHSWHKSTPNLAMSTAIAINFGSGNRKCSAMRSPKLLHMLLAGREKERERGKGKDRENERRKQEREAALASIRLEMIANGIVIHFVDSAEK